MDRQRAADWANIGSFAIVAAGGLFAAVSAVVSWSWWRSRPPIEYWMLGAIALLAVNVGALAIRFMLLRRSTRRAADQRTADASAAAQLEAAALQRALARPENYVVVDLQRVSLVVRNSQVGDLIIWFKYNGTKYPGVLFYDGFAVTALTFGPRVLPRQNAADTAPHQLAQVQEFPVEISLGAQQVEEVFNALPPEFPDDPRNLVTAHQFQVIGALKLRDGNGRDYPLPIDRSVWNATLQLQSDAVAALRVKRKRN